MKKFIICNLIIAVLSLEACSINGDKNIMESKNNTINTTESSEENNVSENMEGIKMFSDELCNRVIEIDYDSFDENKTIVNDVEKIKKVWKFLQSQNYHKLEEDEMAEGLYMIDFVTENATYPFGFGKDIIAFEGNQYKVTVKDNLAEYIFDTLGIKQE